MISTLRCDWRRLCCVAALAVLCLVTGCEKEEKAQSKSEPAAADFIEKINQKGPVTVTLRVSPKSPRLSDLVDLDLIIKAPTDVDVTPPAFGEAVGEFLVRKYSEKPVALDGADRVRTLHYQLEPAHAGKHLIRSMGFEFVDKREKSEVKGQTVRMETEPLEVEITSELGDATPSLANLQPMSAPRELPPKPWPLWVWIAIGTTGLAFGGLLGWWQRRKARLAAIVAAKTPEELAQEAMMALLAENLPAKGLHKDFYVRLTGIVRQYIEQTTGIHAPEQTTEEFLRDMRSRMIFSSDRAERLAAFLEAADMVKYAGQQPGVRQTEESIARAQEFVGLSSALSPLPTPSGKNPSLKPRATVS